MAARERRAALKTRPPTEAAMRRIETIELAGAAVAVLGLAFAGYLLWHLL
jgi:hypothetical protein